MGLWMIFVQNLVVIGLFKAAQQMADPYGSDYGDMPARHFVLFVLKASRMMLTAAADLIPPTEATENVRTRALQLAACFVRLWANHVQSLATQSVRELRTVKKVDGQAWSAWSAAMNKSQY
jgi:hypothetical protein